MSVSKRFFYFCLAFFFGIFSNSFLTKIFSGKIFLLLILIFILFFIALFKKNKEILFVGFYLFFFVFGIFRHETKANEFLKSALLEHQEKRVVLIGIVSKEPELREKNLRLIIKATDLFFNGTKQKINEKVLVNTSKFALYQYGDKLRITGKVKAPPQFEDFNYRDYLKKEGIYSLMNWPEIELLETKRGDFFYQILFSLKRKIKKLFSDFFPSPHRGILEALIFGEESNIPQEWKEKLNITGTRHIAAVSGMNITIITFLTISFLLLFGVSRGHAFYFTVVLLVFYILMIGFSPSAFRAMIMGIILLFAQYLGRVSSAERAIVFAVSIMLFFNPLLLKLDVGFQLSFLATLGIIYLQPIFYHYFKFLPNPKFFPVKTTLAATFAAQIFTLPILIYNFGYFSLVSPLANLLIVPFLAPITILIFIFGFFGIISRIFSYLLFFPLFLATNYLIKVVDFFSKVPFCYLRIEKIHWLFILFFYFILVWLIFWARKKEKMKTLGLEI